jgi:hypothetical protein
MENLARRAHAGWYRDGFRFAQGRPQRIGFRRLIDRGALTCPGWVPTASWKN